MHKFKAGDIVCLKSDPTRKMTIVKEVNAPPTNPRHGWYDV